MTTETSNAREWCPACAGAGWAPDAETADLVRCPDCAGSGRAEHSITVNEASAPPPAAARGDVRGLDLPLIACMLGDLGSNDASTYPAEVVAEQIRAIEALAAEGVQAGDVEKRARELRDNVMGEIEQWFDTSGVDMTAATDSIIASALPLPPEARGVVDEPLSHADLCRLSRVFNAHNVPGLDQDRRINDWLGKRIAAALTGERNG